MNAMTQSVQHNLKYNLPVQHHVEDIKVSIQDFENQVLIVSGSTGCGKSTQIPQIIQKTYLEQQVHDSRGERIEANIVCTQPRKVACRTLAKRVTDELKSESDFIQRHNLNKSLKLGGVVGQQVKDEEFISADTRIKFVTTGVLLNQVVNSRDLSKYTHVVLDEVHERSEDIDFLMCMIRQILFKCKHTKLIVMSATVDEGKFAKYFKPENLKNAFERNNVVKKDLCEVQENTLKWLRRGLSDEDKSKLEEINNEKLSLFQQYDNPEGQ